MIDVKHHIIFYNYYDHMSDTLEEKIQKVRYGNSKVLYSGGKISEFERKLRLKKLEAEDEMEYHEEMFIRSFNGSESTYQYEPQVKEMISSRNLNMF